MKSSHIVVTGRVQGVGYRNWCMKAARDLGIFGWVRNREDGAVELAVQGGNIDEFEKLLWKGPPWSKVTGVSREDEESAKVFADFRIVK